MKTVCVVEMEVLIRCQTDVLDGTAFANRERSFHKRHLRTAEGTVFKLYQNGLEFSRKEGDHTLHLSDESILCKTNKNIKIEARRNIYVKGSSAIIQASDEINGIVG